MILEELIARLKSEDTCWDFWRAECNTCGVITRAELILVPVFSRMWRKNYLVGLPVIFVNWFGFEDRRVVVFIAVLVFVWFWNNVLLRCPDNPRIGQLKGPENWRFLTWNVSRWPGILGLGVVMVVSSVASVATLKSGMTRTVEHTWLYVAGCNMRFDYATCEFDSCLIMQHVEMFMQHLNLFWKWKVVWNFYDVTWRNFY